MAMGKRGLRSRFRAGLSGLRRQLQAGKDLETRPVSREVPVVVEDKGEKDDLWKRQSSFRSSLLLHGSSKIYIWFETVQETGVRFSLDMATGVLSELENWEPEVEMPGGSAIDPEPLSVWGMDSADGRINIMMNVDRFDDLFVDGEPADLANYPAVAAIVDVVRNVVVRDIWREAWKHGA